MWRCLAGAALPAVLAIPVQAHPGHGGHGHGGGLLHYGTDPLHLFVGLLFVSVLLGAGVWLGRRGRG